MVFLFATFINPKLVNLKKKVKTKVKNLLVFVDTIRLNFGCVSLSYLWRRFGVIFWSTVSKQRDSEIFFSSFSSFFLFSFSFFLFLLFFYYFEIALFALYHSLCRRRKKQKRLKLRVKLKRQHGFSTPESATCSLRLRFGSIDFGFRLISKQPTTELTQASHNAKSFFSITTSKHTGRHSLDSVDWQPRPNDHLVDGFTFE